MNWIISKTWLYNIAWEDPLVDYELLEMNKEDDIFYITTGGDNALTYLSKGVNSVTCVDLNPRQNYLMDLKASCVQAFDREEFFEIFGNDNMQYLKSNFHKVKPYMSSETVDYFNTRGFPKSFIYSGSSGFAAKYLHKIIPVFWGWRKLVNNEVSLSEFLDSKRLICRVFRYIFKFTAPLQGVPKKQRDYVLSDDRAFEKTAVRMFGCIEIDKNYFYYPYLTGKMNRNACFDYMKPGYYENLKLALSEGRLDFHTATIENYLSNTAKKFDKFVMLDHYDWMSDDQIEKEYQAVIKAAKQDSLMLFRSASPTMVYTPFKKNKFLISEEVTLDMTYNGKKVPNDRVGTYASVSVMKVQDDT